MIFFILKPANIITLTNKVALTYVDSYFISRMHFHLFT